MKRQPTNYILKSVSFLRKLNFSISYVGLSIHWNSSVHVRHSTKRAGKSSCKKNAKQAGNGNLNPIFILTLLILLSLTMFWGLDGFRSWYLATPFAVHFGMSLSNDRLLLIADKALDIFLTFLGKK